MNITGSGNIKINPRGDNNITNNQDHSTLDQSRHTTHALPSAQSQTNQNQNPNPSHFTDIATNEDISPTNALTLNNISYNKTHSYFGDTSSRNHNKRNTIRRKDSRYLSRNMNRNNASYRRADISNSRRASDRRRNSRSKSRSKSRSRSRDRNSTSNISNSNAGLDNSSASDDNDLMSNIESEYISGLFHHHLDEQECSMIYSTIYNKMKYLPTIIISQIAQFATGTVLECNNSKCDQEVLILNGVDSNDRYYFNNPNILITREKNYNINTSIRCFCKNCVSLLSRCQFKIIKYCGPYGVDDGIDFRILYCNNMYINDHGSNKCWKCLVGREISINTIEITTSCTEDSCSYHTQF